MDNITHEVRLKNWQTIIAQCAARPEGQTAKSWMQENGISEKSYYYWLRRIRREVYQEMTSEKSSSALPSVRENKAVTFAEIPYVTNETAEPTYKPAGAVIQTSRMTVALSNDISDRLLRAILKEITGA